MHLYIPLYSLGRTLDGSVGALGEFWEVMYIKKLPINRPCSRYVMHKNHYFLFGDEVGYMIPCRSFICFHVLVPTSIFVPCAHTHKHDLIPGALSETATTPPTSDFISLIHCMPVMWARILSRQFSKTSKNNPISPTN